MYFNISVLFIVATTSILKLVFPTAYCFGIDGDLGVCFVAIIVAIVVFLFFVFFCFVFVFVFFLLFQPLFLSLLSLLSLLLLLLLLVSSSSFLCVGLLLLLI